MIKAFEPKGFIASFLKKRGVFDEGRRRNEEVRDQSSSSTRKKQISAVQFDNETAFRYNRVDAARLGLSLDARLQNTPLTLRGNGAYNTGTKRWSYSGGLVRSPSNYWV